MEPDWLLALLFNVSSTFLV